MPRPTKKRSSAKIWTVAERARLVKCVEAMRYRDWDVVAESFPDRSPDACKVQYSVTKSRALGAPPRQYLHERKANGRRNAAFEASLVAPASAPPPPVSITAAVFNDPPPGRSALDRKRLTPQREKGSIHASDY